MKILLVSSSGLVLIAVCVFGQESFTPEYMRALREGANAKVTLRVIDEVDLPISNANSTVYFDMINNMGTVVRGVTDDKGHFFRRRLVCRLCCYYRDKTGILRHPIAI